MHLYRALVLPLVGQEKGDAGQPVHQRQAAPKLNAHAQRSAEVLPCLGGLFPTPLLGLRPQYLPQDLW